MPAIPTFTITDNADGTASVAIAGSDVGSTNTVLGATIDERWGQNLIWRTLGSRTSDGAVSISPGRGIFWIMVASALAGSTAQTTPQYAHVTDGIAPFQSSILDAIQARVRMLDLAGIAPEYVFTHTVIDEQKARQCAKECVIIGPADENLRMFTDSVPVQRDDVGYPVVVATAAPANLRHDQSLRDRWYLWGQRIRQAFQWSHLTIPGGNVCYCTVTPLRPAERRWWERNIFAHAQVVTVRNREPRGIS